MPLYIALFRGINVGGKHIVPMQELRQLLGALGCQDVRTYIQSGNALFESRRSAKSLSKQIAAAVHSKYEFQTRVMVLPADDFLAIAEQNPYRDAVDDPRHLHVSFLSEPPVDPNLDKLQALRTHSERFSLGERAFYLHAPDGIGRSKLAAAVEQCLGVATTARNWRTTEMLIDMVAEARGN
jgi:uncharacterized protein (DUF1697 family)